jgi:hypothetical protein
VGLSALALSVMVWNWNWNTCDLIMLTRQTLSNPCHGYGLGKGYELPTCTHTHRHLWHQPTRVCKPVTFPKSPALGNPAPVPGSQDYCEEPS